MEAALAVARRDVELGEGPRPPRALDPFLEFNHLPERALTLIKRVLEENESFRARVLEQVRIDELGPGSVLFLSRPDGWGEELAEHENAARVAVQRREDERRRSDAMRRFDQMEASLADAEAERDRFADEIRSLRSELEESTRVNRLAQSRIEELEEVARLSADSRAEAVRQLKAAEDLGRARLQRIKELTAEERRLPADQADRVDRSDAAVDDERSATRRAAIANARDGVESAVTTASRLGEELAALSHVVEALGSIEETPASRPDVVASPASEPNRSGAAATRRIPQRLGRGLTQDSPEGLEELLRRPGMLVLVDGYNVSMEGWPAQRTDVQRRLLLQLLGRIQAAVGGDIQIVFDGAHEGRRPAVSAPLPVRVHFTEDGVEADDRLLEYAAAAPADRPVVVISSDRRVRDGAHAAGANVVSSAHLLTLGRR